MIRKTIIILIILFSKQFELNAQNFDWQNSARMPFETPKYFIGLGGEYSSYLHKGSFEFIEKNTPCCGYESGNGNGFNFGINALYFVEDDLSLIAGLQFKNEKGIFQTLTSYPKSPNINITTQFQYTGVLNYISLESGLKQYILLDNFSISAGINFDILISDNSEHIEKIISPNNIPFNDGTYERNISLGKIDNLRTFLISPKISLGYDINLGIGTFANLNSFVNIPIFSNLNKENWKAWNFGFGIKIYKGISK